ncbi:hypothetical protein VitviT2T_028208 [Vitis vinifera]|uniref:Protein kinase domain-containing protein n=1 Tax=Vitis vinifera TaxID=29760 RepID=A0ABY9DUA7_VITVI|nr:hypothetical protein VitviT2T_028208 [Vitis vinifera]
MGKNERKECMLRNGGLLLEKRISYFDGKDCNPMRRFSTNELQKATDNYNHENLVMGDIHPGNFYLDQDLCAKLSDFIFSMSILDSKTQVENEGVCGTKGYLAPEVFQGVYPEKSDVFYFGSLLFNLLTGKAIVNYYCQFPNFEDDLKDDSKIDCIQSYVEIMELMEL